MSPQKINILQNVDLFSYNTMGVHAQADYFTEVTSVDSLKQAIEFTQRNHLSVLVVGVGSNMLFLNDFHGMIILNRISGIQIIRETAKEVVLKIGAGENWHKLVRYAVANGYGGIENLALIPGTVGAAPIQNIGAYGVELVDVFDQLEALMIDTGEVRVFDKQECGFGYRDSVFKGRLKGKVIITSVTLKLRKNPVINIQYASLKDKIAEKEITNPGIGEVMEAVIEVRQSKLPDPDEIGNTGSFFKNPVISVYQFDELKSEFPDLPSYPVSERLVKVPAGWLIDQAGWKGKREGDAGVHDKQALVLVNHGSATGEQIWGLAKKIQKSVKEKFGITLLPEVNLIS